MRVGFASGRLSGAGSLAFARGHTSGHQIRPICFNDLALGRQISIRIEWALGRAFSPLGQAIAQHTHPRCDPPTTRCTPQVRPIHTAGNVLRHAGAIHAHRQHHDTCLPDATLRVADSDRPKGAKQASPGQRPGYSRTHGIQSPEGAAQSMSPRPRRVALRCVLGRAFSPLGHLLRRKPRALPWATLGRAFSPLGGAVAESGQIQYDTTVWSVHTAARAMRHAGAIHAHRRQRDASRRCDPCTPPATRCSPSARSMRTADNTLRAVTTRRSVLPIPNAPKGQNKPAQGNALGINTAQFPKP
jgi:hypothetical protein